MQKQIYFKIIELENYQVLAERYYQEGETESKIIRIVFHINNFQITHKLSWNTEDEANRCFINFKAKQAQRLVNSALKELEVDK